MTNSSSEKPKLVEIYRGSNRMEAEVIKSVLDSFEIPCVIQQVASQTGTPSVTGTGTYGLGGGVRVLVAESSADQARELIKGEIDNA